MVIFVVKIEFLSGEQKCIFCYLILNKRYQNVLILSNICYVITVFHRCISRETAA